GEDEALHQLEVAIGLRQLPGDLLVEVLGELGPELAYRAAIEQRRDVALEHRRQLVDLAREQPCERIVGLRPDQLGQDRMLDGLARSHRADEVSLELATVEHVSPLGGSGVSRRAICLSRTHAVLQSNSNCSTTST